MIRRARGLILLTILSACGGSSSQGISEPIADIPATQQRTATRSEFRWDWPFTVGTGTLGCTSDAVVFRAGGVTYALNDAARARGFAVVDPIQQNQGSGPPSNSLKRLKQDERMQLFAASVACERTANPGGCKQQLRATRTLSEAELHQIDAEGLERVWPPLTAKRTSLDPVINAGLKLCERKGPG